MRLSSQLFLLYVACLFVCLCVCVFSLFACTCVCCCCYVVVVVVVVIIIVVVFVAVVVTDRLFVSVVTFGGRGDQFFVCRVLVGSSSCVVSDFCSVFVVVCVHGLLLFLLLVVLHCCSLLLVIDMSLFQGSRGKPGGLEESFMDLV